MGRSWGQQGGDSGWDVGLTPAVQVEERVKADGSRLPRWSSVQRWAAAHTAWPAETTTCIFVANTWVRALDPKEQRRQHFLPEVSVR